MIRLRKTLPWTNPKKKRRRKKNEVCWEECSNERTRKARIEIQKKLRRKKRFQENYHGSRLLPKSQWNLYRPTTNLHRIDKQANYKNNGRQIFHQKEVTEVIHDQCRRGSPQRQRRIWTGRYHQLVQMGQCALCCQNRNLSLTRCRHHYNLRNILLKTLHLQNDLIKKSPLKTEMSTLSTRPPMPHGQFLQT